MNLSSADNFELERENNTGHEKIAALLGGEPSFYIYYSQLASTFTHFMQDAGYRVDVNTYNNDYDQFKAVIERWAQQRVAGIAINAPDRFDAAPVIDRIRAAGTPVVLIGRKIDYPLADYVGVDNEGIGYQAARHLIQLGHTRIAYIGDASGATGHDRAAGYIRALEEASLSPRLYSGPVVSHLVLPAWFTAFADQDDSAVRFLKAMSDREITAAFCFNDGLAVWVQDQIHKLNFSIPHDLSLVSVDNLPFFPFLDAPLTTFALPGDEVGRQAAELILRRLEGERFAPQQVLLPARFIQRLSTAPPRG